MRRYRAIAALLLALSGFGPFGEAAAGDASSHRYLADGRVLVEVLSARGAQAGQLWWNDTVSGASGAARFCREGARLLVEWSPGVTGEARILPDVAVVFSLPPWGFQPTSLGLALN